MISASFNFCSNDAEFIDQAIDETLKFCDDIHVSYLPRFFNGDEENLELINQHIERNKGKAEFHLLPWPEEARKQTNHDYYFYKYCHNICRYSNISHSKYNYVMFMDSDLIPDGERVKQWRNTINLEDYKSYYFMIYSYHRSRTIPTRWDESTVIMSDKRFMTIEQIMSIFEIQALLNPPCCRQIFGLDGKPMFHHYGWVRGTNDEECKQGLLRKTKSWGHTFDKNWKEIIEKEFSHPYKGPWIP